jgi:hypothetical protein
MRFQEFKTILTESNLAFGEIRKDYGKYVVAIINKIRGNKELIVDPSAKSTYGDTVTIEPAEAQRMQTAFFGDISPEDHENLNTQGERNLLIPKDINAAKNFRLKIKGSDQTIGIGKLYKSPDLNAGKGFNTGDVAEGVLGAAVTAKFINRGRPITERDIANVIAGFSSIEEMKSNKKGVITAKAGNDQITFRLVLNKTSFEALYDAASKDKYAPEMKGLFLSGVEYANTDDDVKNAIAKVVDDERPNEVSVNSDGVADQKGTKADLFLNIDGEVINLLSLKAGDVKQFGQGSGYSYEKLKDFFDKTFGINIDSRLIKQAEKTGSNQKSYADTMTGGARENFEAIKAIYKDIYQEIQDEISGNTNSEVVFLQRMYNGIFYHATRNDPNVSMVIMKARPNAPGFAKLTFGEELRKAMEQFDLKIKMQDNPPKIQIYGVPVGEDAKSLTGTDLLLQIRSNLKGDSSEGYVRNIVEMGGLLKTIAKVEQIVDKDPEEPAPASTGTEPPKKVQQPTPVNDPNQTV